MNKGMVSMKRTIRTTIGIMTVLLTALLLPSTVSADKIYLKNGRFYEGVVKEETPTNITISIGLGSITIPRDKVDLIKRENEQKVKQRWKKELVTEGKFVPPGMNDLAKEFDAVKSAHQAAKEADRNDHKRAEERADLLDELQQVKLHRTRYAEQFQSLSIEQDPDRYNDLINRQNKLTSRAVIINSKLKNITERAKNDRETISHYLQQLTAFKAKLDKQQADLSELHLPGSDALDDQKVLFITTLTKQTDQFSDEFQEITVPHQQHKGHMILTVKINDSIRGRFLLDTGASYVTLSPTIAQNLKLNYSPDAASVPLTLANGATTKGQVVVLKSVAIGDASANNVVAMILPESPGDGLDGLLGMSFLRQFFIHIDPNSDTLILKKFNPDSQEAIRK